MVARSRSRGARRATPSAVSSQMASSPVALSSTPRAAARSRSSTGVPPVTAPLLGELSRISTSDAGACPASPSRATVGPAAAKTRAKHQQRANEEEEPVLQLEPALVVAGDLFGDSGPRGRHGRGLPTRHEVKDERQPGGGRPHSQAGLRKPITRRRRGARGPRATPGRRAGQSGSGGTAIPSRRNACRHPDTTSLHRPAVHSAQSRGRSTTAAADSGSSDRTSAGPSSSSSAGSSRWSTSTGVPAVPQELERVQRGGLVEEEIGNEDDQPASAELLDHALQRRRRGGQVTRRRGRERGDAPGASVRVAPRGGRTRADGLVERPPAGGVTLPHQDQREGGGEAAGVVEFREARCRARPTRPSSGWSRARSWRGGWSLPRTAPRQPVLPPSSFQSM